MKGFVITKKDDTISESMADNCISSGFKYGIIIEKVFGVYNNILETLEKKGLFVNPQAFKKVKTNGVIGCFLSHYQLWETCVELNEPIAIFEYDAEIINNINDSLLDTFTDYLNLDYTRHLYLKDIEVYKSNLKPNSNSILTKELTINMSGEGYKFMNRNHIKGAFGYIIKPTGAIKLIAGIKKDGIIPADVALNLYYLNVSYTEPSLVKLNSEMLHNQLKLSHTIN